MENFVFKTFYERHHPSVTEKALATAIQETLER